MFLYNNASWPKGKWKITYDKDKDWYEIKSDYGTIGYIYSTLVAHLIVKIYNLTMGEL